MYSPVWVSWLTPASHRMEMRDPDLSILCFCHPAAPQGALLWAMEGRREGGEAPAYEIQNDTSNFLSMVHQCKVVMWPHLDARRGWKCNPWKRSHFLARFYFMEELWGDILSECLVQQALLGTILHEHLIFEHLLRAAHWLLSVPTSLKDVCITNSLGRCRVSPWQQSVGCVLPVWVIKGLPFNSKFILFACSMIMEGNL